MINHNVLHELIRRDEILKVLRMMNTGKTCAISKAANALSAETIKKKSFGKNVQ